MQYTHDHLILVLQKLYPGTVHFKDFYVAHKLAPDGVTQDGDPFIVKWCLDVPQPAPEALRAEFEANAADYTAQHVRLFRDAALAWSDSKAAAPPDAPEAVQQKAARWQAFRQQLRDISLQPGFPFDVVWPEPPTE